MSWFADKLFRYENMESPLTDEDRNNPFLKGIEDEFELVIVSLEEDKDGKTGDTSNVPSEQRS